MSTPIEVLLIVAEIGGQLGIVEDKLRVLLPAECNPEIRESIREHKSALIRILSLEFIVVRSEILKATILWTPDETTKQSLVAAGAEIGIIFTASELRNLVHSHPTGEELLLAYQAKRRFCGRVIDPIDDSRSPS